MIETIEHIEGDNFGATVIYEQQEEYAGVSVNFRAVEITGYGVNDAGGFETPLYELDGAKSSMDHTDDPKLGANYFRGFVKWDGCSHVYFGEAKNSGYLHLCGGDKFLKLGRIIQAVYERCGELMHASTANVGGVLPGEFKCRPDKD